MALIVLTGSLARADEPPAKRFFMSAQQHFDLGEYADALKDFKEAYRLREDPVFLYNIAQCQRLLNQKQEALHSYQSYLRRSPDAPNREEVEKKIVGLQQQLDAEQAAQAKAPASDTPATTAMPAPAAAQVTASAPPRHKPVYKQWWLWTTVGVVAVGVGLGVGLGLGLSKPYSYPAPAAGGLGSFRF